MLYVAWVVLHCNRHIGASERRELIPDVRFQVPFLGPESQLKSGLACAGLLCKTQDRRPAERQRARKKQKKLSRDRVAPFRGAAGFICALPLRGGMPAYILGVFLVPLCDNADKHYREDSEGFLHRWVKPTSLTFQIICPVFLA